MRETESNRRIISGYASIAGIKDSQGDIITLDALRDAWGRWRNNPDFCVLSLLHSNIPLAKVIFEDVVDSKGNLHRSGVDSKGLYLVAEVRGDTTIAEEAWDKIKRGELRGFSIGGRDLSPKEPVCIGDRRVRPITDLELYEVAIVDQPANRASLFNVLKRDDLAKLAEATQELVEHIVVEGAVKISKHPCPDSGYYHVLVKEGLPAPKLPGDKFAIITEPKEGEEYVNLFDLALLRPESVLAEGGVGSGDDPPPPQAETPNTPTPQGGLTLDKEKEEVKTEQNSSNEDEIGTSKTPETEEKGEECIAPLTLETLAASLAQIAQRLEELEKSQYTEEIDYEDGIYKGSLSYAQQKALPDSAYAYIEEGCKKEDGKTQQSCRHMPIHDEAHVRAALAALKGARTGKPSPYAAKAKPKICAAAKKFGIASEVCGTEETEKVEKSAEPGLQVAIVEPAETAPIIHAPVATPQPDRDVVTPPESEPTKPVLQPVEIPPTQPKAAPVVEAPPLDVIKTRGVASPQTVSAKGFNVAEMYRVPWSKIHEAKDASLKKKIRGDA